MRLRSLILALVFTLVLGGLALGSGYALAQQESGARPELDAIYVPTPHSVAEAMLRLAEVGKDDIVYDLGSGDGRIVIAAARDFGARGVGIELDPERIRESRENARQAGVEDRVEFRQENLFTADISQATVVTLYLWQAMNVKLRPRLLSELRPGTRIVAQTFDIGEWRPDKTLQVQGEWNRHNVFLWRVPAPVAGEWRWRLGRDEYVLRLQQVFQEVSGSATVRGREVAIEDAKLEGDRLEFTLPGQNGNPARRFRGRVEGERITGTVRAGERQRAWRAQRVAQAAAAGKQ